VPPHESAQVSTATSAADGLVTIAPLQIVGEAEVTNIVGATGTEGFVSLSLQKQL